jgi:hypothetical protein
MPKDMGEELDESKTCVPTVHKAWIAMCVDLREHEVVGLKVGKRPWSPFEVWIWMLCEAARMDRQRVIQGRPIMLARGQLAVSLRYLAREADWSVKAVRRFLERLRKNGMISLAVTPGSQMSLDFAARDVSDVCPKRGTGVSVLTICNYDKYQHAPTKKGTGRAQQGHRKGTGRAQDNTENNSNTPLPPKGGQRFYRLRKHRSGSRQVAGQPIQVLEAYNAYNDTALRCGLSQAAKLTPDRRRKIAARLREYGLDGWKRALANIEKSAHLTGGNDRGWRADLEFVCQAKSFGRLHDGGYGNGRHAATPSIDPQVASAMKASLERARRADEEDLRCAA